MDYKAWAVIGALLVVLVVLLVLFRSSITGLVTYHATDEGVVVGGDSISIPTASLKTCCTFTANDGTKKTCTVIEPYGCGYCAPYC
jgi:hypothetical protein